MKLCGLIAEFNPFTNGHAHIIAEAKRQTGLDVACIMSGNFVQRGEEAILDKYTRASCAIKAGACFVVELPQIYALSSASLFAESAIKCLMSLGCISHLAFGITLREPQELEAFAKMKVKESLTLKVKIKENIKNGDNYNVAMYKAYASEFPEKQKLINHIFASSNNILAVEYLSAIYKMNANITPVYIQRLDNGYNSFKPTKVKINRNNYNFVGATYIRECLYNGKPRKIKKYVPPYSYEQLKLLNSNQLNLMKAKLDAIVLSSLRQLSKQQLYNFVDYNQGLASLIEKSAKKHSAMSDITEDVSSKCYRKSRIKRLLLLSYFQITKECFSELNQNTIPLNVLAVDKNKKQQLLQLIKQADCKLIISRKDVEMLTSNEIVSININQRASNLYNIISGYASSQDLARFI